MRTLADMTTQESAQCRGMWCEDEYGEIYIYLGYTPGGTAYDEETDAPMGTFIDTQEPETIEAPLTEFTPRFDIPRAWQADGQPPAGEWEYAKRLSMGVTAVYLCGKENPTHRQWIGKWEEV